MNRTAADYESAYNPRIAVPEFSQHFERWGKKAAQARAALKGYQDVAYGTHPMEKLDIFRAKRDSRALLMYIHGGYWRALDKNVQSFSSRRRSWSARRHGGAHQLCIVSRCASAGYCAAGAAGVRLAVPQWRQFRGAAAAPIRLRPFGGSNGNGSSSAVAQGCGGSSQQSGARRTFHQRGVRRRAGDEHAVDRAGAGRRGRRSPRLVASSRLSTRTAGASRSTSSSWMWRRSSRRCTVMPSAPAASQSARGLQRIGLVGPPGLPHGGHVIDVDVEPGRYHCSGSASGLTSHANICQASTL